MQMISIVDDDEAVREAMARLVRSLGYNATTFASADEYLDSECVHDTSCLITDVQMPGRSARAMSQTSTIAIVDDDKAVRELIKLFVRSLGYNAAAFASADEYLNSGRVDDTSCLITDVQMPGLSGIDLQDRLIASGHRIPTIFITAYSDKNVRMRAMKAGAVAFLSKPFDHDRFLGCLGKALEAD